MTTKIDVIDITAQGARPIEIYEFSYGTRSWRYCTGGENVVIAGRYCQARSIRRKAFTRTDNVLKGGLKVQVEIESHIGQLALDNLNEHVLHFKLYRGDLSHPEERHLMYVGKMVSYNLDELSVELDIEPPTSIGNHLGFTPKYQRMCRHRLYTRACGMKKLDWTFKFTVPAMFNPEKPTQIPIFRSYTGIYDDGLHFYRNASVLYNGQYRNVLKTTVLYKTFGVGTTYELTLSSPIEGLDVGEEFELIYGCTQTRAHCHDVFGNVDNYGGFDFIPTKNPFAGVRVW